MRSSLIVMPEIEMSMFFDTSAGIKPSKLMFWMSAVMPISSAKARARSMSKPSYSLPFSLWNSNGAKSAFVPTRSVFDAEPESPEPPQPATAKEAAARSPTAPSSIFFIFMKEPPLKSL